MNERSSSRGHTAHGPTRDGQQSRDASDGRAAPADQAAVDQQHLSAGARRREGGIHAGRTGADDEDLCVQLMRGFQPTDLTAQQFSLAIHEMRK